MSRSYNKKHGRWYHEVVWKYERGINQDVWFLPSESDDEVKTKALDRYYWRSKIGHYPVSVPKRFRQMLNRQYRHRMNHQLFNSIRKNVDYEDVMIKHPDNVSDAGWYWW